MSTPSQPIISLQIIPQDNSQFSVHFIVSNLPSELSAQAAAAHIQRLFCGGEIKASSQQAN